MTVLRPRGSINRPEGGVDQSPLVEHRKTLFKALSAARFCAAA